VSLDADTIIKHQGQLASDRFNFDTWWQEIAYRVMPQEAQFTTTDAEGTKRTERLFDSTAAMANERFAAVMEDLLTGRTQIWHGLKPPAKYADLMDLQEVRAWYEAVRDVLFQMRYSPRANFASQKQQGYESLGAFGNSCMFIDEAVGDRAAPTRYISCHMREVYWAEDQFGRIDTVYRKFELEGRKAIQRFGDQLGAKLKGECEKDPFKKFWFIHCVKPNEERKPGRLDYQGMAWSSYYVSCDAKAVIHAGGFTSWPYAIGRYKVGTRERYGRGPAMLCWPAILTLQEQKKTILRAGQLEVHPPVLLTEEGILGGDGFSLRSGALNYGALTDRGEPLAAPFKTGANVPLGAELLAIEQTDVKAAFLQTVFEVLVDNPQMTATQVLEIAQQRGVLLAPTMGRQHSEDLGPLIEREIDIANKAGLLPPMPPEIEEIEGEYETEYTSPLARAMRAQDALAIARTFEMLPGAIAIDKTAAYVIDVPASIRELAEINGMPAKLVRDKKAVDEITSQNAEAEQAVQAAELAPDISTAALNAAKAEELRASI
jgi:hypothetical protein